LVNCLIYQGFLVLSAGAPPRDQTATNPSEAGRKTLSALRRLASPTNAARRN